MIYHINFYTTQENIEGPYDQWEFELTMAFATREEAVAYAQRICKRKRLDTFNIEEEDL